MKDTTLFSLLLELPPRWRLTEIIPDLKSEAVLFRARALYENPLCPHCSQPMQSAGWREERLDVPGRVFRCKATLAIVLEKTACRQHGLVEAHGSELLLWEQRKKWMMQDASPE